MTIKDLKEIINNHEQDYGNSDELELWVQPPGTPSCKIDSVNVDEISCNDTGVKQESDLTKKFVLSFYISGDIF